MGVSGIFRFSSFVQESIRVRLVVSSWVHPDTFGSEFVYEEAEKGIPSWAMYLFAVAVGLMEMVS